jgi:hypothetical protein
MATLKHVTWCARKSPLNHKTEKKNYSKEKADFIGKAPFYTLAKAATVLLARVARWYIFKPKILICENFGGKRLVQIF